MIIWERSDILNNYAEGINRVELEQLRDARSRPLERPHWHELREALSQLPTASKERQFSVELQDVVQVSGELTVEEAQALQTVIRCLIPWRKGPIRLFQNYIDAEWRSDFKWQRVRPWITELRGKRVLDVGCGNGYYMLRAAAEEPELVLGLDPSEAFFYQFETIQRFVQLPHVQYELAGIEDLAIFDEFFDLVLCMGVLYHQRNPLEALHSLKQVLRPGGELILESQSIPGEQSHALFPAGRYAKARNVYFVPTPTCLLSWVNRAGFVDAEICSEVPTTFEEQRQTAFAPYESLADFLDPEDSSKTVEGYPAPRRTILRARKR